MHPTTARQPLEQLITTLSEHLTRLTRTLGGWVQHEQPTLAALEQQVVRLLKELGATLLSGLGTLECSQPPASTVACACGQRARLLRWRGAQVITLLGPITIERPYYLCTACGHGQAPLDQQLQICAGSRSQALDELLALLGATQASFAEAASVLERLTLLHLSPNSVRDATEELGTLLHQQQSQQVVSAQAGDALPRAATPAPTRLYVTMDGVLALLHERGWSEIKVGCCYQTRTRRDPTDPERVEVRAECLSYLSSLREAEHFGWQLWCEAVRRGVLQAEEVVDLEQCYRVVPDGDPDCGLVSCQSVCLAGGERTLGRGRRAARGLGTRATRPVMGGQGRRGAGGVGAGTAGCGGGGGTELLSDASRANGLPELSRAGATNW
jgi:Uncharacterised protein family (UPF0236)